MSDSNLLESDIDDTLDAVAGLVIERAGQLIHAESTDFLGRMAETLMQGEILCNGGLLQLKDAAGYHSAMLELAALAMAQAAMATGGAPAGTA